MANPWRSYTASMKATLWTFALCALMAVPVQAQEEGARPDAQDSTPQIFDLFERMLRGFMRDAQPHLRELERDFTALEPELQRLLQNLRDMTQYHPPEILPNGDILIRRRQGGDTAPEPAPDQDRVSPETESDLPFEL
ncbi:hypothetical protein [Roseinatronobacter thiooxidans]|nr:hypothetical protein [Roseinatronobacter thiooxidans]